MFAHKRRQERKPGPGDQVGQSLVTCTPRDTFSMVSAHLFFFDIIMLIILIIIVVTIIISTNSSK